MEESRLDMSLRKSNWPWFQYLTLNLPHISDFICSVKDELLQREADYNVTLKLK